MEEDFEEVTKLDKPALFTHLRIDLNTVPQGYHLYEVCHDDYDQGDAVQIAKKITVNHWGTLITNDSIELPHDGYLDIQPGDLNYSTGDCENMKEFMEKYPPESKPPKNHERSKGAKMKSLSKFENVDVINSLRKIMLHNTRHYQSDFENDNPALQTVYELETDLQHGNENDMEV